MRRSTDFNVCLLNVRGSIDRCVLGMQWNPTCNVMICTETWMDSDVASAYKFPHKDFCHFWACRRLAKDRGGVSVFVQKHLPVRQLATRREPEVLCLSFGSGDILLVACYASPNNSGNSACNIFDDVAQIMAEHMDHKYILLAGDFNARVGELCRVCPEFDANDPIGIFNIVSDINSGLRRHSIDKVVSGMGRQCISFCEHTGVDILNGAIPGDLQGAFTFTSASNCGSSVIDLFMTNAALTKHVSMLEVVDMHDLTDHCAVYLTFRS